MRPSGRIVSCNTSLLMLKRLSLLFLVFPKKGNSAFFFRCNSFVLKLSSITIFLHWLLLFIANSLIANLGVMPNRHNHVFKRRKRLVGIIHSPLKNNILSIRNKLFLFKKAIILPCQCQRSLQCILDRTSSMDRA